MVRIQPRVTRAALLLVTFAGVSAAVHRVAADAPAARYNASMGKGTVYDTKTTLTWQQAPTAAADWKSASSSCTMPAPTLPGTGWRLPTMKELQTLVDEGT